MWAQGSTSVLWHDPAAQITHPNALLVDTVSQGVERIRALKGLPRLVIVRRDTADNVARMALKLGRVTVVFDELDQVCRGKSWLSDAAREIVHYGRHSQIALLGCFRRTANVHEDILSQAHAAFIFRHSEASKPDCDALRGRFGDDVALAATQLEPMRFLVWRDA